METSLEGGNVENALFSRHMHKTATQWEVLRVAVITHIDKNFKKAMN